MFVCVWMVIIILLNGIFHCHRHQVEEKFFTISICVCVWVGWWVQTITTNVWRINSQNLRTNKNTSSSSSKQQQTDKNDFFLVFIHCVFIQYKHFLYKDNEKTKMSMFPECWKKFTNGGLFYSLYDPTTHHKNDHNVTTPNVDGGW